MELDDITLYKKLNPSGTTRRYKIGDLVLYRDRLFVLKVNANDLSPPSKKSTNWAEIPIPSRLISSTTEPVGLKFVGDRWFNPLTLATYTYVRNGANYIWVKV